MSNNNLPNRRDREDDANFNNNSNTNNNNNNNNMMMMMMPQSSNSQMNNNNNNAPELSTNQRKTNLTTFFIKCLESGQFNKPLWLAYVAFSELDRHLEQTTDITNEKIASKLADSLIDCYNAKEYKADRAMSRFDGVCSEYFSGFPQRQSINDGLGAFLRDSTINSTITNLLAVDNRSIKSIIYDHFKKFVNSKIYSFYEKTALLIMSPNFHDKTVGRFVGPGKEQIDEKTITYMKVGADGGVDARRNMNFSSSVVNILSGWSGAGKTTLATSKHAEQHVAPICIVLGVKDLFDDQNVDYDRFCTVSDGQSKVRDTLAAILLINAIANVLHQRSIERKSASTIKTITQHPITLSNILDAAAIRHKPKVTDATKERTFVVEKKEPNDSDEPASGDCSGQHDAAATQKIVLVPDLDAIFADFTSENYTINWREDSAPVRIVLDEGGACPVFVRAICNMWRDALQPFFAKNFLVKQENLYFFVAGTGLDTFSAPSNGSFPTDYALYRVESGDLFARLLQNAAETGDTKYGSYGKMMLDNFFNSMYEIVGGATRQRPCTHQVMLFLRLVSDNARCAGLAMKYICAVVEEQNNFLDPTGSDQWSSNNDDDGAEDLSASLLLPNYIAIWCFAIPREFVRLNGLSRAANPINAIGTALSIVMSRREETLSAADVDLYLVKYGILVDAGEKAGAFRYRIQQSLVMMLLLVKYLGVARPYISVNAAFEVFVAEHHALCLVLNMQKQDRLLPQTPSSVRFFQDVASNRNVLRVNLNASFKLEDGYKKAAKENKVAVTSKRAAKPAPPPPLLSAKRVALFNKFEKMARRWTDHIHKSGGSVVIVNGPEASNADVFVLTKNMLLCTQCKYYKPSTALSGPDRKEEFVKMITGPRGVFTRELLMNCCRGGDAKPADGLDSVKVRACIFFLYETSISGGDTFAVGDNLQHTHTWDLDNGSKFTENFIYDARYIWAISTNQDAAITVDSSAIAHSELYPILVGPLDDGHLARGAITTTNEKNKAAANAVAQNAADDENVVDDEDASVPLWQISVPAINSL